MLKFPSEQDSQVGCSHTEMKMQGVNSGEKARLARESDLEPTQREVIVKVVKAVPLRALG